MDHLLSFSLAQEAPAAVVGNVIPAMAVLAALILKSSDLIKYLWAAFKPGEKIEDSRKQARNSLVTLLITSVAGVLAAFCSGSRRGPTTSKSEP